MATAESTLELVASEVVAQVLAEVVADVIANDDLAPPTSPSEALRIDVPLDDESSAEKVPPDAVALKIDPSVADGFAPNLGSPTGDPQLGGYPPDCGTKHYKYLSFAKCRRDRGLTHPMCYSSTLVDKMNHPVPVTYPVCGTDFGAHSFHKLPTDSMVLSKYGLGIALYFKFLKVMAWLFLVMFILSVPAMAIFVIGGSSNMDAVTLKIRKNPISVLGMTSMGNLGQQTTTCGHAKVGDALTLTCDYGEIGSLVASYSSYDDQGTCACPSRYAPNDQGACQASPVDVSGVATCLASGHGCYAGNYPSVNSPCCAFEKNADGSANFSALQVQTVAGCSGPSAQSIVQGLCLGQTSCTINVTESSDYLWKADSSWNTTCPPGGNSSVFCSAGLLAGGDFSTCPSPSTRGLLVVAQCFTTQIDISNSWAFRIMGWDAITRPLFLKMAVGLDVIACAVFLLMVVWMKRQEANAMARIEHERTTVQNYTVQLLHLPKHTDVLKLGVDLATHLETVLTAKEPVYNPIPVKVADVHFGMTNAVQIDVMRKRGTVAAQLFLENQRIAKFKALQEKLKPHIFEKRLGKLLKASRALDEKLQKHDKWLDEWEAAQKGKGLVAVTAYITFEDEEGYLRCLREYPSLGVLHRLFQPYHKRFMKKRMRIEPAPDPTDIIWENLDYSWAARMLRVVCVNIVALALLLLSFLIIYLAKTKKNELTAKFATPLACPVNVTQWDVIQEQTASSSPAMAMVMCYCKAALLATASLPATMDLEFYNPTTQTSAKYCKTWGSEYLTIQALMVGSVVVVVLVNALLTPVLQYLVRLQKSHTLSAVIVSTVRKIFLAQFFNTTLIVLFLNANLSGISTTSDTGFHFVGLSLLNGKYADFSVDWYNDVGVALLLTMLINAISPQIGVFVTYLLRQVAQWRDRSFTFDFTRTRQETQRDLEALYRGPEFDLATRYSQIINTIFITLLFSSGMPLMLLIGLFSIIITYWTDKFTFLRVVRSPPQYDGRIATVVGSMLPYAILLHMLFGIWMYSNTNIFQSPATELTLQGYNLNAVLDKGGKVVTRATAMPAAVLFAAAVAGVAVVVVRLVVFHYLGGALRSVFPMCTRMLKETKPPRHLPNYFDALPLHVLSDGLGSASLKPSLKAAYAAAISRRSTEAKASLQLSGCHSYDILHNPSYKEAFGGGAFARQLLK